MPTKKSTTKKPLKKIKQRKAKPQTVALETPQEERERMAMAVGGMILHPGWEVVRKSFQENIDYLANQIIEKKDETGKKLTEIECDELRFKKGYLEEMLGMPAELIKRLTSKPNVQPDPDPYDSTRRFSPSS